VNTIVH